MQNYDDLQSYIAQFIARPSLAANIPTWVFTAEKEIVRRLRVFETQRTTLLTPIDGKATLPIGHAAPGDLRLNADRTDSIGKVDAHCIYSFEGVYRKEFPQKFAIINDDLILRPTPPATIWSSGGEEWSTSDPEQPWGTITEYLYRYYGEPSPLGPNNLTNELFPKFADIYQYGTLWQACMFLRNTKLAKEYLSQMIGTIDATNQRYVEEKEADVPLEMAARPGASVI